MSDPAFCCRQVIDDTNKWIEVDIGSGDVEVSIAEQIYDDIRHVASALQTALIAVDATFTVTVSSLGFVTIARTGSFTIPWATGSNGHGSGADDDHIGDILGFDDSADDTGAATYTSDNQAFACWFPEQGASGDTYSIPLPIGGATFVSTSAKTKRTTWATHYERKVSFQNIPSAKIHSFDAATLNEDFLTWYETAGAGRVFTYYSDTSLWTDEGEYCLTKAESESILDQLRRYSPGDAYYSFDMLFRKAS